MTLASLVGTAVREQATDVQFLEKIKAAHAKHQSFECTMKQVRARGSTRLEHGLSEEVTNTWLAGNGLQTKEGV